MFCTSPHHPAQVHAVVPVEAPVLDGQERLGDVLGEGVERDDAPVDRGQGGEALAVHVQDLRPLGLVLRQLVDRGAPAQPTGGIPNPGEADQE
jgi:hypothetical protein